MPKLLLCVAIVLLPFLPQAQKACTLRLLMNADEINKNSPNAAKLKSVEYSGSGENVIADTYDNKKIVLLSRLVWGYQDQYCTIYRNTGGHFFKVEQADGLIIYSLQSKGFRSRLLTHYYFSRGLDGPLYLLDGENLMEQYKDNSCFVKKLKQEFNSPFSRDYAARGRHSFTVVELLRSCE